MISPQQKTPEAEVASLVRQSIGTLSRRLRGTRSDTAISLTALSVLGRLHRNGGMTPSALAVEERIQPQSLTRVLAALDDKGLIERHSDPTDRRQVLVSITEPGRSILREDARLKEAWLRKAIAGLSPTEREVLRLAAVLMDQLADQPEDGDA